MPISLRFLSPCTGSYRVVTNLGILGYDDATKRMTLLCTQPGATVDEVIANTGFDLLISDDLGHNLPPTSEELRLLRSEVDKEHLYI